MPILIFNHKLLHLNICETTSNSPKLWKKISLLELIESLMLHRMKMGVYFWAVTQREI